MLFFDILAWVMLTLCAFGVAARGLLHLVDPVTSSMYAWQTKWWVWPAVILSSVWILSRWLS